MQQYGLITLIKSKGIKSSKGFDYSFILNITIDCLESDFRENNHRISFDLDKGKCALQLVAGNISNQELAVISYFGSGDATFLQKLKNALPDELLNQFNYAEFGAKLTCNAFSLNTKKQKIVFPQGQIPCFPNEEDPHYHLCNEMKKDSGQSKLTFKEHLTLFKPVTSDQKTGKDNQNGISTEVTHRFN
jgi:hypothetical protein